MVNFFVLFSASPNLSCFNGSFFFSVRKPLLSHRLLSFLSQLKPCSGFAYVSLNPGGGGTPIHCLYGYVPPNGVVILKLLIYNGVSISEAFSRTGYNISNARKLQFCKQPFEISQGQIAFKNTVRCINKQTVVIFAP